MDFHFLLGSPPFSNGLEVFSWGRSKGLLIDLYFLFNYNVIWHFGVFHMKWVFALIFASQNVLKLFFSLVLIASFEDVVDLFIVIYLISLKESGSYLPKYFLPIFKVIICH
jgi:hypothetical protein